MPTIERLGELLEPEPPEAFVLCGLARVRAKCGDQKCGDQKCGDHERAASFCRRYLEHAPCCCTGSFHEAESLEGLEGLEGAWERLLVGLSVGLSVGLGAARDGCDRRSLGEISVYLDELG